MRRRRPAGLRAGRRRPCPARGRAELLRPAIRYADEGFLVTPVIARRWRVGAGRRVAIEGTLDPQVRDALQALGHQLSAETPETGFGFGAAQITDRARGGRAAGSDPRKDGHALGC